MARIHVLLVTVNNKEKGAVLEKLHDAYPSSTISLASTQVKESKFLIKMQSEQIGEVLKHEIEQLKGINEVVIRPAIKQLPKFPRRYSTFLMIGLGIFWPYIVISTFLIPNNPLETMTNSQLLVFEVSIALAISVWIFFYDKKSQQEIIDVLANITILTNDINQNVSDLSENDS